MHDTCGLDRWRERGRKSRERVALLTHPAAVDRHGRNAANVFAEQSDVELVRLLGPEHGFFGWGGAGEKISNGIHPVLHIPIHSCYGDVRKPPLEWFKGLDRVYVDLQDLGVRCYTYCSTLAYVLEQAQAAGIPVTVLDRPIPAPGNQDGPMLEEACRSFVGLIDTPLCTGMTPGDTARWLQDTRFPQLDLEVVGCQPDKKALRDWTGNPWVPPSPGIRCIETAEVYPTTVFSEAFPAVSVERSGLRPFRVWHLRGLDHPALVDYMNACDLVGVCFDHTVTQGAEGKAVPALQLTCLDPLRFKPIAAAVHLLSGCQEIGGTDSLWGMRDVRPDFFDKLMGSTQVREGLQRGASASEILAAWS